MKLRIDCIDEHIETFLKIRPTALEIMNENRYNGTTSLDEICSS